MTRDQPEERPTPDPSEARRYVSLAERRAGEIPDVPPGTPTTPVAQAAVVGCGTMGRGIAMAFANAGIPVTVVETSGDALDRGLADMRRSYAGRLSRGRISAQQMAARLASIEGTADFAAVAEADFVVEAVFEELDLKRRVFAELDRVCKPAALLATNTSTLDVDAIAAATSRPEKVLGTHFFSPAHVMRLVEVVRGAETAKQTLATAMKLAERLGKIGVMVGVCDGFVGNRMLYAYTGQANVLLEEGALPQDVDRVIAGFGFPMGPFAMGDLAGLDVGWRVRRHRAETRPGRHRALPIADRLCEEGRFGQKTGAGWYRYDAGSRRPIPDPAVERLIRRVSEERGTARRSIADREILERCLYPLINEGARILEEGLALRASDIDVIWIRGYGFPADRGGPMYCADRIGLKAVHDVMARLHADQGDALAPAALLAELARTGRSFAEI